MKIAYVISESNGKTYWNRIGVAFVNKDGSINVKLSALPVNGELQIRDYVPAGEPRPSKGSAPVDDSYDHLDAEGKPAIW